MKQTLERRVATLEKNLAKLATALGQPPPPAKDWRRMAGCLRDTETAREADRLGRKYREAQNKL
jgi:hypothetical protein